MGEIFTPDERAKIDAVRAQFDWARDLTPQHWRALLDLKNLPPPARSGPASLRIERYDLDAEIVLTPEQQAHADALRAQDRKAAEDQTWTGAKFDPERSTADLAGLIRADLTEAVRHGVIPADCYIVAVNRDDRIRVTTAAYRAYEKAGRPYDGGQLGYQTDRALNARIGALLAPYNQSWPGSEVGETFFEIRVNDDNATAKPAEAV